MRKPKPTKERRVKPRGDGPTTAEIVKSRGCKDCPRWEMLAKHQYTEKNEICSEESCLRIHNPQVIAAFNRNK